MVADLDVGAELAALFSGNQVLNVLIVGDVLGGFEKLRGDRVHPAIDNRLRHQGSDVRLVVHPGVTYGANERSGCIFRNGPGAPSAARNVALKSIAAICSLGESKPGRILNAVLNDEPPRTWFSRHCTQIQLRMNNRNSRRSAHPGPR